jgi:hypothetical protein
VTKSNYTTLADGMHHVGVTSPYPHTGLTNGKTYYFVVTSVNAIGESVESSGVSATPLDTTPPTIVSTDTTDGAKDVRIDPIIKATFSEALAAETIDEETLILASSAGRVSGTVQYADKSITFVPSDKLELATVYIATLSTNVKDLAGNALAANYAWSFTTTPVTEGWVARYNGLGDSINSFDGTRAVGVDAAGNVYVTGASWNRTRSAFDYATIKYNANGNEVWVARYSGPEPVTSFSNRANALVVDPEGHVYVTGATASGYTTINYDPDGNELWVANYSGLGNVGSGASAIAVDLSGNVYVTGFSSSLFSSRDYATIKYDANGNELWVARYNGPGNHDDFATALIVDAAGNVYVTGWSSDQSTADSDYATIKYDANGNQLWVARYKGPDDGYSSGDFPTAIAVDTSGYVYVTGSSESIDSPPDTDIATIKYDANGNELWVATYKGPKYISESATSLIVDAASNVYITGTVTIKYDANGNQLWVANDQFAGLVTTDLAIDTSGNIYVTGYRNNPGTYFDYVTIKYASTNGNKIWEIQYNGPRNSSEYDVATALALDAAGNVYVTGVSVGAGTSEDCATIKYIQAMDYAP